MRHSLVRPRLTTLLGRAAALALGLAGLPASACAAPAPVRVVGVMDGDTVRIVLAGREEKLRLAEIDAPEKAQPFGQVSKEALIRRCMGQPAQVITSGKDRYGRLLGRLTCGGEDVNAAQVREGMAWVYDDYVRDRSLYVLQAAAKTARRGLWRDPEPQAPWLFRKAKRDAGGDGRR